MRVVRLCAIWSNAATISGMVLVSRPAWSSVALSGKTPSRLSRPSVGLNPIIPQSAAGTLTEPPVSVPSPSTAPFARATEAADPPLEPPATLSASCGFLTGPKYEAADVPPRASSCMFVLPRGTHPEPKASSRISALRFGTKSLK